MRSHPRCEAPIRPSQVLAHVLALRREPAHVCLVDHRVLPRGARPHPVVVLPVERRIDHHRLGHRFCAVRLVDGEIGVDAAAGHVRERVRGIPTDGTVDCLRVWIDEQLGRIETQPRGGVVAAVNAVAVPLPRTDAGEEAVPVERRPFLDGDPFLIPVRVEQAELDTLGVLREQREVGAVAIPALSERKRVSRPDRATHGASPYPSEPREPAGSATRRT